MEKLIKLYDHLESVPMSLLASRPGMKKAEFLVDMILYYGLTKKKRVTIYTTQDKYWLQTHILAHLNETNTLDMEKYLHPCIYNFGTYRVDKDRIPENLQTLWQSKIRIDSLERIDDYTDFILENATSVQPEVIIIYDIEPFFKNGNRSPKEVLDELSILKNNSQVILVSGVNRGVEETENYHDFEEIHYFRELEPYIDETILLYRKPSSSSSTEIDLVVYTKDSSFEIKYNTETDQFE